MMSSAVDIVTVDQGFAFSEWSKDYMALDRRLSFVM